MLDKMNRLLPHFVEVDNLWKMNHCGNKRQWSDY